MALSSVYVTSPKAFASFIASLCAIDAAALTEIDDNVLIDLAAVRGSLLLVCPSRSEEQIRANQPLVLVVGNIESSCSIAGASYRSAVLEGVSVGWIDGKHQVPILLLQGCDISPTIIGKVALQAKCTKWTAIPVTAPAPQPGAKAEPATVAEGAAVPKGQLLPTILPSLLSGDQYRVVYPNSAPVRFSNDLFEGQAVVMVNTRNMAEPFLSKFRGDENTFEVQVQGKFKKLVPGVLFVGAEITKQMELGLLTRGLCASILSFCRRFNSLLHHSFGDKDNMELPHITSPLWNTVDRLVITPPGSAPPALLDRFVEPEDSRKARKKDPGYSVAVDFNSIYSFSLKTAFMDLERWAVVNIPLMSTMALQTFWADADLRFLAYAIDPTTVKGEIASNGLPKYHTVRDQQRLFSLEVKHAMNHPEWGGSSKQFYAEYEASPCEVSGNAGVGKVAADNECASDDGFFDAGPSTATGGAEAKDDSDDESACDHDDRNHVSLSDINLVPTAGRAEDQSQFRYSMPAPADMECRPFWQVSAAVEVDEGFTALSQRKRRTLYAFSQGGKVIALKSYQECKAMFPTSSAKTPVNFARLSKIEQRRVALDATFRSVQKGDNVLLKLKIESFLASQSVSRSAASILRPQKGQKAASSTNILESVCFVQHGNRLWSQEIVSLSNQELVLSNGGARGAGSVHLPAVSLISVRPISPTDSPLASIDTYGLIVGTFSKQYTIIVLEEQLRNRWVDGIQCIIRSKESSGSVDVDQSSGSGHHKMGEFSGKKMKFVADANPDELAAFPKTWILGDKIILNARNFTVDGHAHLFSPGSPSSKLSTWLHDPAKLSARLLELAFQLARDAFEDKQSTDFEATSFSANSFNLWIEFLDGLSLLQRIDLSGMDLGSASAVCTFLNIFHCLIIHAALIIGIPSTLFKWQSFFRKCAYDAFGDIFSLAELEHCIIRNGKCSSFILLAHL